MSWEPKICSTFSSRGQTMKSSKTPLESAPTVTKHSCLTWGNSLGSSTHCHKPTVVQELCGDGCHHMHACIHFWDKNATLHEHGPRYLEEEDCSEVPTCFFTFLAVREANWPEMFWSAGWRLSGTMSRALCHSHLYIRLWLSNSIIVL